MSLENFIPEVWLNGSNSRLEINGGAATSINYDAFKVAENDGTNSITFKYGGDATFSGTVTPANVTFNLEADDDTKYTSTTNEEGEQTLVYNGAVLDVKDRLQKTDAALQALKTAAAAATDFASLQTAIATALADI